MAKPKDNPVKFEPPEGFTLPDGIDVDEPFEMTGKFVQDDDGKLEIIELDGLPVGEAVAPPDPDQGDDDTDEDDGDSAPPAQITPPPAPAKIKKPMTVAGRIATRFSAMKNKKAARSS